MQTLYLVRHTAPRVAPGVCYGQLDVDVADSFGEEAVAIRDWLPPVELIIASPLRRTRRLAEYLAGQQGCAWRSDARLMEMHFGDWEGRRWNDIPRSELDAWTADILNYTPPDGESARDMLLRLEKALRDLARHPQRHIAVVAHAGSIRGVLALAARAPLTQTLDSQIDYGAVIGIRGQLIE